MDLPEIAKVQLQQSVETYRTQLSLLIQVCTVFVLADATTVGYGIQQQLAGILWIGLVFPLSIAVVFRVVARLTIPILATAVSIEANYAGPQAFGLVSTFVAVAISHPFLEQLRVAAILKSEPERTRALSRLKEPYMFAGGRYAKIVLGLVAFCQAIGPIFLWLFAGWHFFSKLPQKP